jgi:tetratricopeptide (TPR) repeat protein
MTRRSIVMAVAMLVAFAATQHASRAESVEAGLARFRSAANAHPEDPDLAFAYARKLAAAGENEAAVQQLDRFVDRWPERRPTARVEIAGHLIESGSNEAALELLDVALVEAPSSGMAFFYRGIALRNARRLQEADRDFQFAIEFEPGLRPEAMLARALGFFEMGREDEAVDLLRGVLEIDPTGDSAMRARLLLRQRELLDFRDRFRIEAYAGFEWDDNVTLENAEEEVLPSGRKDFRGIWGLGGSWRAWVGEEGSLTLGYRYDQTEYNDLSDYDLISNTVFAATTWRPNRRLALRLDNIVYNILQDREVEVTGGLVRPNLIVSLGSEAGAITTFASFEIAEYEDTPTAPAWERDAITFGGGVEYFLPFFMEGSWLTVSASWARSLTEAKPSGSSDGFDGDYDYDSIRLRAFTRLELPFEVRAQLESSYSDDDYLNDNFDNAASVGGSRRRHDQVVNGRFSLSRSVFDHVRLEAYVRVSRRYSNLNAYGYDRQVVGALVRFASQ